MDALKELLAKQKKAFAEFKKTNDERLEQLEKNGSVDPVLADSVEKANTDIGAIQKQLDEMQAKMNRPGAGGSEKSDDVLAHEKAFSGFVRKGIEDGLEGLEAKALNVGTDADGGYAVPEELDRNILTLMKNESPMRQECQVVQIGAADYKKLVDVGGTASGWVGETTARPETNTPQLAQITPYMGEVYANPAATQQMLDDSFFDAEGWLAQSVAFNFAEYEAAAFLSGTGVLQPKGILDYTSVTTADDTRAFGTLQHIAAAAAAVFTGDELITMVYTLKKSLRTGSKWMMNSLTTAAARKLKDSTGQYLWQPGLAGDQPSTLLGYAIAENEDMPDATTGNTAIMFGNLKRAYLIVDRMGIRTLRDPYTNKPYVHFYSTKRVGGMLQDSNAVKLLLQA